MYNIEFSLGCGISVEMAEDGSVKIVKRGFEAATVYVSKETTRALAHMLMSMVNERDIKSMERDILDSVGEDS